MTETTATTPPEAPVFPPDRYGRRRAARGHRRFRAPAALAVVVLLGGLVAYQQYRQYGDPAYDAQMISYTDITATEIVLHFRVNVPDGGAAVCAVRARDRSGAQVGSAQVPVAGTPGESSTLVEYPLATSAEAFIGEVLRCRAAS